MTPAAVMSLVKKFVVPLGIFGSLGGKFGCAGHGEGERVSAQG